MVYVCFGGCAFVDMTLLGVYNTRRSALALAFKKMRQNKCVYCLVVGVPADVFDFDISHVDAVRFGGPMWVRSLSDPRWRTLRL